MTDETNPDLGQDSSGREAAWQADRETEARPLPGAEQTHYESEDQRQAALAAAEEANVAKAAGELGLTSAEWHAKRAQLGRSPSRGDL